MPAEDNRRAHFFAIVDAEIAELQGTEKQRKRGAYRAVAYKSGLKEEYIYQLYTGIRKKVGEDATTKLSAAYGEGRAIGWTDLPLVAQDDLPDDFEPSRPPTVDEAIAALAEVLSGMNPLGREMVANMLSAFAKNPEENVEAAANTIKSMAEIHKRLPDKPTPAPTTPKGSKKKVGESASAQRTERKTALVLTIGGGQKRQLSLPLSTVRDPFDKRSATANERAWYERVKAAPKASGGTS